MDDFDMTPEDFWATHPLHKLADKYADRTMIERAQFIANLELVRDLKTAGSIVECGTWRGGMLAAMAELRPGVRHFGLDSFQGLPPVQEVDGVFAQAWQADTENPRYFDNCTASIREFHETIYMAKPANVDVTAVRGWFNDTVPEFSTFVPPIAVLRLDGDWYESTKVCLEYLFDKVVPGGLVIIDDYRAFEGCQKAVDEFMQDRPEPLLDHDGVVHISVTRTETENGASTPPSG